jgi:tetratricopeptide (TPR) repeat protein
LKRPIPVFAVVALALSCQALAFDEPDARKELFAARYENAVALYSKLLAEQPAETDAGYGLVRAELGLHQSREAYAAAEQALRKAPESAGAQTAAGLAMYRRGEVAKAEAYFRAALKINPNYPGALTEMASVYATVSRFKTARELRLAAYGQAPDDPELMAVHANTLKGAEHIAALEEALGRFDPASEQARNLRVHIANDRAVGTRKLGRLVSPYAGSQIKLFRILEGPSRLRGFGVSVLLNQKQTVNLLLDTGASGIAVSPKLAERAGLQLISGAASEVRGIGDQKAQASVGYLASEARAGEVVFADYPISVFRAAQNADYDGLIGADVFQRFLVKVDFPRLMMSLEARPEGDPEASDEPVDWAGKPAPGFDRVFRFGDHMTIPTFVNGGRATLFLIDSGAMSNLVDTETAKEFTKVSEDPRMTVRGVQGAVNKASRTDRISLVFGGFRQEAPQLTAISLEKMGDSFGVGFGGILGLPVLGNLAVTIDYRSGTIKFDYKRP